jgi:L-cysteine desulfidase
MDASTGFALGALAGALVGAFGAAAGFLYVLKTRYVIPSDEVQAELAEVLNRRKEAA